MHVVAQITSDPYPFENYETPGRDSNEVSDVFMAL